jgi:anaerobic selenocysteine-containing dehydrogenase
VRALFNIAGNPATVFPDQRTTVTAMKSLDLLVSIEPTMTTSARLSHYIIPPKLMFERPDGPMVWETVLYSRPFAQYTPAVATPPAGSKVVDEWYPMWAIAARLGRQITFCGEALDLETPPDTEHLLDLITRDGQVPLSEVRKWPGGFLPDIPEQFVEPADPEKAGEFDVAPSDIAEELAQLAKETDGVAAQFPMLLAVRRMREVMNSSYREIPAIGKRASTNPIALAPEDLATLALEEGQAVRVISEHGAITSQVTADATLRRGVVTMSHGFGGLPDDHAPFEQAGANVNLLVSLTRDVQSINGMARFSGIPVRIEALV